MIHRLPAELSETLRQALAGHDGVADFAILPLSGDPAVVVVLSEMGCVLEIREELRAVLDRAGSDAEPAVLAVTELPAHHLDEAWFRREMANSPSASRYAAPATALEHELAACLARVLNRPRVGVLDDFVDLGGDSVLAVRFVTAVRDENDLPLTLIELFGAGTVRRLAQLLTAREPIALSGRG